jgi:hypothetical protein
MMCVLCVSMGITKDDKRSNRLFACLGTRSLGPLFVLVTRSRHSSADALKILALPLESRHLQF